VNYIQGDKMDLGPIAYTMPLHVKLCEGVVIH